MKRKQTKKKQRREVTRIVEYLISGGENCGYDRLAQPQSDAGTARAKELKKQLESFASIKQLEILPGTVSE